MTIGFKDSSRQIVYSPDADFTNGSLCIYLQPTADELETLHTNAKANRDAIWDYTPYYNRYLEIVIPTTEE